jgi:hypothetical protein
MSTTTEFTAVSAVDEAEYATFYVGDVLLGIPIREVQEINRNLDLTVVPHGNAVKDFLTGKAGHFKVAAFARTRAGRSRTPAFWRTWLRKSLTALPSGAFTSC